MGLRRIGWAAGVVAFLVLASPGRSAAPPALAVTDVCVVPMTTAGGEVCGQTVLIERGRIARIAPAKTVRIAHGAERIDGRGKWLMPGLADMHVHVENDNLLRLVVGDQSIRPGAVDPADVFLPYLANGVLQVANLAATSESLQQRALLERGDVAGPHMALAAMVDGSPPIWPLGMTRIAVSAEEGRNAVRAIKAEGYDFVKVYSRLGQEAFDAILDEAARQRIKVLGHIPGRGAGRTEAFLKPGLSMVTHAEEFAYQVGEDEAAIPRLTRLALASGVWLIPTLTLDQRILEQAESGRPPSGRPELAYLHPLARRFWTERNSYVRDPGLASYVRRLTVFNRRLVQAFAEAGVPMVAGTDSIVPGVMPGFSLHDEIEAMQAAGISPERVLASATRLGAEWLGVAADRGTVEVGKRADLIVLDADPLRDVANTRKIAYVLRDGRPFSRAELDRRMESLAARYAAAK